MSIYSEKKERLYVLDDLENKFKKKSGCRSIKLLRSEDDKRTRREVANNNERRRMQSINTGFESLRKMLPFCTDKEKISKASILQSTAKYITDLRMKITCLEDEISKLSNSDMVLKEKCLQNTTNFNESNHNSETNKDETQYNSLNTCSTVDSTNDLSSLSSSMTDNLSATLSNFNSEEMNTSIHSFSTVNESIRFSQQQNNLEQLLAAVEQVERLEAMQEIPLKENYLNSNKSEMALNLASYSSGHEKTNFLVMKPMISPFAEKIIQDVVNMKHPCKNLTTSIIGSNSFILPINVPNYITSPIVSNNYLQKSDIPNNHLHRNNVV